MEYEITRRDGTSHVVLFDEADLSLVSQHRWFIRQRSADLFYAATNVRRTDGTRSLLNMHTLLVGLDADHINHNGLDNRRVNLRTATRSQQVANRRLSTSAQSKYKGVSPLNGRYLARCAGKYLGTYATDLEAAQAYDDEARESFGEYAFLNLEKSQ